MEIPADTLAKVLELRNENGLEPTEAALRADLEKAKAKWTLAETPRYRRAGRSPIYISGKYLTATGICPATGESDERAAAKAPRKAAAATPSYTAPVSSSKSVDETAFYKVLHGKGFLVKITQNLLTGEVETQLPAAINNLGLKFGDIPANATDVYVSQTSPQIQVSLPLDKFLELAGIKA